MLRRLQGSYWPPTHTVPYPQARILDFAQGVHKAPGDPVTATITFSYTGQGQTLTASIRVYSSGVVVESATPVSAPVSGNGTYQAIVTFPAPSTVGVYDVEALLYLQGGALAAHLIASGALTVAQAAATLPVSPTPIFAGPGAQWLPPAPRPWWVPSTAPPWPIIGDPYTGYTEYIQPDAVAANLAAGFVLVAPGG